MENRRGQGALEYLILIGAAMVVVAIVIAVIIPNAQRQQCENEKSLWVSTCNAKGTKVLCEMTDLDGDGTQGDCVWDDSKKECTLVSGKLPGSCAT
ncbi:MAG: class III signal peptide-containing protein [Candidatus Diapherotrites archaeon]